MSLDRALPSIIEEDYFNRNSYFAPNVYIQNPENTLAENDPLEYLELVKDKIYFDHEENMERIRNNHEQIMKGMEYQAANNYVSGLNSQDRLEIEEIQTLPYVLEDGWFGLKRKVGGITLKIKRK